MLQMCKNLRPIYEVTVHALLSSHMYLYFMPPHSPIYPHIKKLTNVLKILLIRICLYPDQNI